MANGTYGIKDLAAPFIMQTGTLGDLYREFRRTGLIGLYRLEIDGWHPVAKRYFSEWTLMKNIINK